MGSPAEMRSRPQAFGSGGSVSVEICQSCGASSLEPVFFAGYLPPVNSMATIGSRPTEQPAYPAQLLRCERCELIQLGLIVDAQILFPPEYPYTSGTTKILRDDFAELTEEVARLVPLTAGDLVVDVGSNDGTLLSNFQSAGHRVRGVEPTDQGRRANDRGIPTDVTFFDMAAADSIVRREGRAKVVTAANVFAHIEGIHDVIEAILTLLGDDGVFVSESHYWLSLVERLQYDTVYHEHLRYYSLTSLRNLLNLHGLDVFHAKRIPTHGGSIRVYATRTGRSPSSSAVAELLEAERRDLDTEAIARFRAAVTRSKLELYGILRGIRGASKRVYGVGAPSRATTLINYVGLDEGIVDRVVEISGSQKIGRYVPGTLIPVVDERELFADEPDYALLFSWHIADELIAKFKARGFGGDYIVPLPVPHIVSGR